MIGLSDLLGLPLKTHGEHVVLDASAVAPAPRGLDPVAASTIALNALTADQALDALALPAGSTLLVTGAAGAVGGYAVQLARHRGLEVVACAAAADEELVRELGAQGVVPRGADLPTAVRALVPGGVDGVVDAAPVGAAAHEALRNRGAFAHLAATPAPAPLRGARVHTVLITADGARWRELVGLVEAGVIGTRVAGGWCSSPDGPGAQSRSSRTRSTTWRPSGRSTGMRESRMSRATIGTVRSTSRRVRAAPSDRSCTQNSTTPRCCSHSSSGSSRASSGSGSIRAPASTSR